MQIADSIYIGGDNQHTTPARLAKIREIHLQNPDITTQKTLRMVTAESPVMVSRYFKMLKAGEFSD